MSKLAWQNTLFLTLIFQFFTWLQYVLEAVHLYCIAVQQKRPCCRLQVTHLSFSHFQGFGRFTWTADSWFNVWQCQLKDTLAFLHDHTTRECITHGYKLPFLLWNMLLDDDKAAFWWDNKKHFYWWCLICIFCRKLHSFDFHVKYHLYVTFIFKGRSSFKNSQYGSWPLNVSTNHCTSTRKFYYYYVPKKEI